MRNSRVVYTCISEVDMAQAGEGAYFKYEQCTSNISHPRNYVRELSFFIALCHLYAVLT